MHSEIIGYWLTVFCSGFMVYTAHTVDYTSDVVKNSTFIDKAQCPFEGKGAIYLTKIVFVSFSMTVASMSELE